MHRHALDLTHLRQISGDGSKVLAGVCVVVVVLTATLPAAAKAPPGRELARLRHQVTVLKAKVRRLQAENGLLTGVNAAALRREMTLQRHVASVDPCAITKPNGSRPPGSTFGAEFHGNGSIWVGTWYANVVVWSRAADGSVTAKFGWWRGVPGELRIEGHRLDAAAPPFVAHVPQGYGDSGFQASGITFPTEGCWQVTGPRRRGQPDVRHARPRCVRAQAASALCPYQ